MVKAGHPQKACPHPSVCNLCWCFDLMSHWVFRQKLPGMAFLYFPHVLCFISTLYFFLFYFQSLALLCSFPFHSATVIDLYSFCFFFFLHFFSWFIWFILIFSLDLYSIVKSSLLLWILSSINFPPLFSLAPYLAKPQPRYCECSKFPLCLPASAAQSPCFCHMVPLVYLALFFKN